MPRSTRNAAFDSEFGHRLQVLLEQYLKLSVAQLTETLGYESSATIRRALSGKGALDLAKLRTLAAINTQEGSRPNLDWLITGIGRGAGPRQKTALQRRTTCLVRSIANC